MLRLAGPGSWAPGYEAVELIAVDPVEACSPDDSVIIGGDDYGSQPTATPTTPWLT